MHMKTLQWKTLESNYLFKDNWLTARRDRCAMPDGRIVDPYYVLEYPDWVNAAAFTREGRLLLIRQYRHALGEVTLEVPGGCMDKADPTPLAAMQRELLEETGYAFDKWTPLGEISSNPSTNNNLTHMFVAEGGKKIQGQQLDPNEEIEVRTYAPEEVMQLLAEHKIVQSLHVSCLYYAFQQLGMLRFQ